jgi:hypothetical protein
MKYWILVCVLICSSCAVRSGKSYREYNLLNANELESVTAAAENGDAIACRRLYVHFYIGMGEFSKGRAWLRKGAEFGDRVCMEILKSLSTE